jgi:hypothetical protein
MTKVYYVLIDDQNNYYDVAYDVWCPEILDAQRFYYFDDALESANLSMVYGKKVDILKVEVNIETKRI